MNPSIEAITTASITAALDLAVARHTVVAGNLANAHTEGYAPRTLDFEAQLADARAALQERGRLEWREVESMRSPVAPSEGHGGARVQIDAEMTQLAQNAVQFQALVQGLSRHLGLLALAAADGRK